MIVREIVCTPPPHVAVHVEYSLYVDMTQLMGSVEQGCELHD